MPTDMKTDVELLKRDIDRLGVLFDKLDVTIEKLTEVSSSLNRMLAVHENRLVQQEESTRTLFSIIEDRRRQSEEKYDQFSDKITSVRDDIQVKLADSMDKMSERLDEMAKSVNHLDRWKYFVIGGAIVIGFLISRLPILEKLFVLH